MGCLAFVAEFSKTNPELILRQQLPAEKEHILVPDATETSNNALKNLRPVEQADCILLSVHFTFSATYCCCICCFAASLYTFKICCLSCQNLFTRAGKME